ncbi:hypothetical protein GCM10018952_33390 [Streptosporangium vulgare]
MPELLELELELFEPELWELGCEEEGEGDAPARGGVRRGGRSRGPDQAEQAVRAAVAARAEPQGVRAADGLGAGLQVPQATQGDRLAVGGAQRAERAAVARVCRR